MGQAPSATINGFGRFGLGLLSAWFEDPDRSYLVQHINDDVLTIEQIAAVLQHDQIVSTFHNAVFQCEGEQLTLTHPNGERIAIRITTGPLQLVQNAERPRLLFDCSGRAANFAKYRSSLRDVADLVLIGATTEVADATLVMGYNEIDFDPAAHRIVSFGSCTVIPGIHVVDRVHAAFGVRSALVNIVHSVPRWRLEAGEWTSVVRKACSLEAAAAVLIPSLPPQATKVNYTYAPYVGTSVMDFAFSLERAPEAGQVVRALSATRHGSPAASIVGLVEVDHGPDAHLLAKTSIDIVKSSLDVRDDRVYFFGYFNNDGSGNRLHELAEACLNRMANSS